MYECMFVHKLRKFIEKFQEFILRFDEFESNNEMQLFCCYCFRSVDNKF